MAKVDAHQLTDADYAEIPEATEADFARATVNKGGVPVRGRPTLGDKAKKQVTLRLDPAVILYFRSKGDGWQSRMNRFLSANETVLRMIGEFEESIEDMERMITYFQSGELRMALENKHRTIGGIERTIRNVKETVRSLREQLDFNAP